MRKGISFRILLILGGAPILSPEKAVWGWGPCWTSSTCRFSVGRNSAWRCGHWKQKKVIFTASRKDPEGNVEARMFGAFFSPTSGLGSTLHLACSILGVETSTWSLHSLCTCLCARRTQFSLPSFSISSRGPSSTIQSVLHICGHCGFATPSISFTLGPGLRGGCPGSVYQCPLFHVFLTHSSFPLFVKKLISSRFSVLEF